VLFLQVVNELRAESCKYLGACTCKDRDIAEEGLFKVLLHKDEANVHDLVQRDSNADEEHTNDNSENHFIRFSLLNTLLPNVVLHAGLLGTASVTKVHDVLDQPLVDTL